MNAAMKQKFLDTFDALTSIELGAVSVGRRSSSRVCAHCGVSPGPAHEANQCPIAVAIRAIVPLLPRYEDRAKWLVGEHAGDGQ